MDDVLKRRLLGALIVIAVVFVASLLLPGPGSVSSDPSSQRVTLDLTGNSPEPAAPPATATPVPPVIAAAPTQVSNTDTDNAAGNDNTPPPQIDEPPLPAAMSEPAATNDPAIVSSEPSKPVVKAEVKPAPVAAMPKASAPAPAASVAKPEIAKIDDKPKPSLKLEDTLKHKPEPATTKPVEKEAPKVAAKVPTPIAPKVPTQAAVPPAVAAKPPPASQGKHWYVQLGAFSDINNAHQVLDKLAGKGLKGLIAPLESDKGTRYRARLGPFASRDKAKEAQDGAAKLGYAGSSVLED